MKNIFKPYFLFFTVTLPQVIIFGVFYKLYQIVGSELSAEAVQAWSISAAVMGLLCIIFTIYGAIMSLRKKDVHPLIAAPIFAVYITFLTIYFLNSSRFIPSSIPAWLFMGIQPGLTLLTLTMPALAHTMLIAVHWTIEKHQLKSIEKDMIKLLGIPFLWYTMFHFIVAMFRDGVSDAFKYVMPILFIISAVAFFFYLVRIIYIVLKRKALVWKNVLGPLVLAGSILGLMLNQAMHNLFGNFSHYSFYILAAVTSLLLIIPEVKNLRLRLAIFIARSMVYAYSIYFFIVFLPYLPLSLAGIAAFGVGVLMLTPLILMLLHTRTLYSDFINLSKHYKKSILILVFAISLAVIPTVLVASISDDRVNMDKALSYAYQRSYSEKSDDAINVKGVKRAIENIKGLKNNRDTLLNLRNIQTPYLSTFYNWYVLDGITIADSKINRLERIFLGADNNEIDVNIDNLDNTVYIKNMNSNTVFDLREGVYKSWVDLELQNSDEFQREFTAEFQLQEGSYISDYYLYVGNEKKHGMLADKRAANWVYNQNKIVRRDPGIITNIGGNNYELKVFPFSGMELRKTGIEITHRTPITLNIKGKSIVLDDNILHNEEDYTGSIENKDYAYVPKGLKEGLEKVTRKPAYYFVIDCSMQDKANINKYIDRIKEYIESKAIGDSVEGIIAVNYNEKTIKLEEDWNAGIQELGIKGGLNLDYTIKRILYDNYSSNSNKYPAIIVSTDNIQKAILSKDFEALDFALPEGAEFYHLRDNLSLDAYSLLQRDRGAIMGNSKEVASQPVLAWQSKDGRSFYLPDNKQDSIILLNDDYDSGMDELEAVKWKNGVMLKAAYMSYMLHPEKYYAKTLSLVKNSITSNIMSPLTSFIVLENKAQENAMLLKQKELLLSDRQVDISDMTEMDEPSLLLIAIPLIFIILLIKRRNKSIHKII